MPIFLNKHLIYIFFKGSKSATNNLNSSANHGIMPRFLEDLFVFIGDRRANKDQVSLKVSCVEIYLEKINDLLNSGANEQVSLKRKKNSAETIITEIEVLSLEALVKLLLRGSANRKKGGTQMNAESSRSHALTTFYLEIKRNSTNEIVKSKLNLVDLAGSESQKKANTFGTSLKEGISINKGLSVLGKVVN